MKTYIGSKIINAKPMTRGEYNAYRGWTAPEGEAQDVDGYLVEYTDGGAPNTADYAGYVSWTPKPQFDGAYRETQGISFGLAVEALKRGKRVARTGWNGKGMWLSLRVANGFVMDCGTGGEFPEGDWIGMKTADDKFVPWLASQTDVLADDWQIVTPSEHAAPRAEVYSREECMFRYCASPDRCKGADRCVNARK